MLSSKHDDWQVGLRVRLLGDFAMDLLLLRVRLGKCSDFSWRRSEFGDVRSYDTAHYIYSWIDALGNRNTAQTNMVDSVSYGSLVM